MVYAIGVLLPPNWDRRYTECFGFTLEDIYAEGFQSFETKMRTAGLPLEEIQYALPDPARARPEGARRARDQAARGGLRGREERAARARPRVDGAAVRHDPALGADTDVAPGELTIQWDFADAEPWHVRVDNGSTSAEPGRHASPDVTLRCRFDDWVDVVAAREDPRKLMLRRKIRPKGSLRSLYRMSKVFPR